MSVAAVLRMVGVSQQYRAGELAVSALGCRPRHPDLTQRIAIA